MTSKVMWGIYMLSLSVLKHLFVNFRLLCENMKASKPIAIMFCLEYVMKENIILKSMQAKDKAVWACVCVW